MWFDFCNVWQEEPTRSSSSMSTSLLEDTSPESVVGNKGKGSNIINHVVLHLTLELSFHALCPPPPGQPTFLPVSAAPHPDKHRSPQRRHSIEKEAPTSVRPFAPPSRQSSKSLVCSCTLWMRWLFTKERRLGLYPFYQNCTIVLHVVFKTSLTLDDYTSYCYD